MKETIEVEGITLVSSTIIADRYGIVLKTIPKWVRRGLLPQPVRIGRNNYFDTREVSQRIARGE